MAYDRTLIKIRERSFLDLLDLALVVLRRNTMLLGTAAIAGILPIVLLNAWVMCIPEFPPILFIPILVLEIPWVTAPLTVVLGGLMFGERPTARQVVRSLLRGLPAMIIYQGIVRAILLVSVIFYPLVPTRLAFLDEVILLERGKIRSAVKRSSNLCADRGSDYFGQWLAQIFFGVLFVACFWFGTGMILGTLFEQDLTLDDFRPNSLGAIRLQVAIWIAVTFFGVARFLTYIDQRIRLEGWEIKLRLQAVGQTLEEASRW